MKPWRDAIGAGLLVGIALSKILTTSAAIGLGMPGGIIGPSFAKH